MVVAQAVVMEEMLGPVQPGRSKKIIPGRALMPKIVDRETNPRMSHAQMLINFVKEHRHQAGLPVVAMDDLRVLAGLEHELEGRPAEKSESAHVIVLTINRAAVEKILPRMRINKETFAPVHSAEPNRGLDGAAVPRHPQPFI